MMLGTTGRAMLIGGLAPSLAGFCQSSRGAPAGRWPHGAVVGENTGMRVGEKVLAEGGNAVDAAVAAMLAAWRPSLLAGFLGAFASQFWFLAFALASAASVRTLALVEVLFAQAISKLVFKQRTSAREALGIVLIVVGVALLVSTN